MKLQNLQNLKDLKDLSKEDILDALGLTTKSASTKLFSLSGAFAVGLLVGAGAALLLAPKTGRQLRDELGGHIKNAGGRAANAIEEATS